VSLPGRQWEYVVHLEIAAKSVLSASIRSTEANPKYRLLTLVLLRQYFLELYGALGAGLHMLANRKILDWNH